MAYKQLPGFFPGGLKALVCGLAGRFAEAIEDALG
jgi:hypothetical protein